MFEGVTPDVESAFDASKSQEWAATIKQPSMAPDPKNHDVLSHRPNRAYGTDVRSRGKKCRLETRHPDGAILCVLPKTRQVPFEEAYKIMEQWRWSYASSGVSVHKQTDQTQAGSLSGVHPQADVHGVRQELQVYVPEHLAAN